MHDLFRHEALPFAGPARFASSCAEVVRDGVENDERILVLASAGRIGDVRDELGDDADVVSFIEMDEHGRNPHRVATMLHTFQVSGDGRPSVGVNEVDLKRRSRSAMSESRFAESLLNEPALRSWPMTVVCLYDADGLDSDERLAMLQSHAVVRGQDTNVEYDADLAPAVYAGGLEPAPARAVRLSVDESTLGRMREFVRRHGTEHGIAPDRVDDLVLAANEIVTNSLRHGGGRADMDVWFAEDAVVCQVRDGGFIQDVLAGRFAPPPSAPNGRGLWLANHLCDLVQVRSSPGGSVVRMHVDR